MRKSLLLALLVGAATPALAAGDPGEHRDDKQAERNERQQAHAEARSDAHVERTGPTGGQDRPHFTPRSGGGSNSETQQQVNVERDRNIPQVEPHRIVPRDVEVDRTARDADTTRHVRTEKEQQSLRERVVRENHAEDTSVSPIGQKDRTAVTRIRTPVISTVPREGTQPPLRVERRSREHENWSTTKWRNDHRYDWQNYRHHHRSIFHLGLYYDPFGWGYRPYSIGWRLWPSYYGSRYWINDPWMYRLPYAPPGYVWVRYWDDALLVDTWSGEVVDVIRDFFW